MQESFQALGIEWPQIVANMIGFIAFFLLMRKFAWGPMLEFMSARNKEIREHYETIEREYVTVQRRRNDYDQKMIDIKNVADQEKQKKVKEGKELADALEKEGQEGKNRLIREGEEQKKRIIEQAMLEVRNYVVEVGVKAGLKATYEVIDEKAHEKMVERFVEELSNVR